MKLVSVTNSLVEGVDLEGLPSYVARHGKIKEDNGRLLKFLIKSKHWSPLEHVFFTFQTTTSRAISAQIFRHWSLKFQELSQRYDKITSVENINLRRTSKDGNRQSSSDSICDIGVKYYEDEKKYRCYVNGVIGDKDMYAAVSDAALALESTMNAYSRLIELGVAKETARMLLPMASTTYIHISGTLKDILAFLNTRLDHHTQLENREVALEIAKIVAKEMPIVAECTNNFNDYKGMFM